MTDHILATLKREHASITARIKVLDGMLTAKHLNADDAKAMAAIAARFNAAKTIEEKSKIAEEGIPIERRWNKAVKLARNQSKNYMKWLDEKTELESARDQLQREISHREYYAKKAVG